MVRASRMEHHANDLPWRKRGKTIYAEVDAKGRLILEDVERLLKANEGKVKYVTITAASNVTGYVNNVHAIAKIAHKYGAQIIVDGAQIVAHRAFSMAGADASEDIDYFVFAGHKMYAPFGSGAVVGLKKELGERLPVFYGGGMVDVVTDSAETYLRVPETYESGSPNYLGIVAMLESIRILKKEIGFEYIEEHEQVLLRKMISGLQSIPGITLYGDVKNITDKVGLLVFNVDGISSSDVAQMLAEKSAIAVRQGAFCSHPYVFRLLGIKDSQINQAIEAGRFAMPGMVRASFGIYSSESEVDIFLETVKEIAATRKS
jgi:selenocysteine lyase/cysteine desulfurase